jgi:hypothetical protein
VGAGGIFAGTVLTIKRKRCFREMYCVHDYAETMFGHTSSLQCARWLSGEEMHSTRHVAVNACARAATLNVSSHTFGVPYDCLGFGNLLPRSNMDRS